jgi:very-short-patch-repair endonuclease
MPRSKQPRNTAMARKLRREMTLPEVLLWNLLRRSPDGVSFRRQHYVDPYFLDFYCARVKLCIEVDGIAHDMGDRPQRDAMRDAYLFERGIEVMRIPASEVLKSPEDVAEALVRYCKR